MPLCTRSKPILPHGLLAVARRLPNERRSTCCDLLRIRAPETYLAGDPPLLPKFDHKCGPRSGCGGMTLRPGATICVLGLGLLGVPKMTFGRTLRAGSRRRRRCRLELA